MNAAALAALALAAPVLAASATPATDRVAASFDAMKALVGRWRPADDPASTLRIRFSLTAAGSVLVEEWSRRDAAHSLTLYHRDGMRLIATHYCPQGNQPRLALMPAGDARAPRFRFLDATDLDPHHEAYLVALSFDMAGPDTLIRRETYREHGRDDLSELRLVRER